MRPAAGIMLAFVLAASSAVFPSCKKDRGEPCLKDSDCRDGLICEGKRCLPHLSCDLLEKKVTECTDAILTVRDPARKVTDTMRQRYLAHFRSTYLQKCRKERGAYEDDGVARCFELDDCRAFARCLLNLEKGTRGVQPDGKSK